MILRVDGGFKSGIDVLMAAAMGADEYGFGSVAMIATGCVMARICHTNNCPVGVASQVSVKNLVLKISLLNILLNILQLLLAEGRAPCPFSWSSWRLG